MVLDIWQSFRRMPLWVQIWVAVILVPVNAASIFFVTQPMGVWIAILAIGGMAPNLIVMAVERGFSRTMALPHVVIWTPLVILLVMMLTGAAPPEGGYRMFLILLLVVDVISLGFDYIDTLKWWKGAREIA